jgi:hypothetical protein
VHGGPGRMQASPSGLGDRRSGLRLSKFQRAIEFAQNLSGTSSACQLCLSKAHLGSIVSRERVPGLLLRLFHVQLECD